MRGIFGNNWLFYIFVVGENVGMVVFFVYGFFCCEIIGLYFIRNSSGVNEILLLVV